MSEIIPGAGDEGIPPRLDVESIELQVEMEQSFLV